MKKRLLILLLLFCCMAELLALQSSIISGTVVDEKGQPLEYASVFLVQTMKGTVTNSEGNFSIICKTEQDTLVVSYLGYEKYHERITPTTQTCLIQLKKRYLALGEVAVHSLSAPELLQAALKKIPDNYEQKPFLAKTYYRGKAIENDEITYIQEAALDIVKSYKPGANDDYYLIKNRYFRMDANDQLLYKGIGGQYDYVGNARKEFGKRFFRTNSIQYLPSTTFDNRMVYVLVVCPAKDEIITESRAYEMKIYIDAEDYAFVRFEYKMDDVSDIFTQYKKFGDRYFLISGRQKHTQRFYRFSGTGLTYRTMYGESTMITTDIRYNVSKSEIKGVSIDNSKRLETYDAQPDDSLFWKEHNGLLPDSSVIDAIRVYERKQRIVNSYSQARPEERKLVDFAVNSYTFNKLYPQEKVYVHFDNTGYFMGETIWFKAYVVTSENHALSSLSRVLYVELLTPEGEVLETKKLKIEDGQARGSFNLEDRYDAGYYQVRAYTRYMLNFGDEVLFSRVLPVYDKPMQPGEYQRKTMTVRGGEIRGKNLREEEMKNAVNLAFFPEGGHLIQGITSRVAFKATGKNGEALYVTGNICTGTGREMATFASQHLGMGAFVLRPDSNKLVAKVRYDGMEYTFDLPESRPAGYSMLVDNLHPEILSVRVEKNKETPPQLLGLTIACRGKIYSIKAIEVDETGQYTFACEKDRLPSGVCTITLFTPQGEVLAQRMVFVNNIVTSITIKATHDQSSLKPFAPVFVEFEVKDTANKPIEMTFSLSVRDEAAVIGTNCSENILNNLLLSSDLKGYIENPAWYFETDDDDHRLALDLLMMVQGWTRYSWKHAAGVEPFVLRHDLEKKLMIDGTVIPSKQSKSLNEVKVTMWVISPQQETSQKGTCRTNASGRFGFELSDITGTFELKLQAKKRKKPYPSTITLDRHYSPAPAAFDYYETRQAEPIYCERVDTLLAKSMVSEVQTDTTFVPDKQADIRTYSFDGFAPEVAFYSPDYIFTSLPEPDFRRTICWSPDVKTDHQGRATVYFFNNGTCKKLSLRAEGITEGGEPVVYEE